MCRANLSWLVICCAALRLGAQTNAALWMKHVTDGRPNRLIPWVVANHGGAMAEVRYNFDAKNTLSAFAGPNLSVAGGTLTPTLGFTMGEYKSVSAELYAARQFGSVSVFVMNQAAKGAGSRNDFLYHWTDVLVTLTPNVRVGLDEQVYWETATPATLIDVGPVLKLLIPRRFGTPYVKLWTTKSPKRGQSGKFFVGAGFVTP